MRGFRSFSEYSASIRDRLVAQPNLRSGGRRSNLRYREIALGYADARYHDFDTLAALPRALGVMTVLLFLFLFSTILLLLGRSRVTFPVIIFTNTRSAPTEYCEAVFIKRDTFKQLDADSAIEVIHEHQRCTIYPAGSLLTRKTKRLVLSRTVDLNKLHTSFDDYQGIIHSPTEVYYQAADGTATSHVSLFHVLFH